jgi:hypothetical protein
MNANKIAEELENISWVQGDGTVKPFQHYADFVRNQQALIENLNGRIERMIEKQSHYEAMAHAGGFEAGRQQGMKQERALWQLAASTQEIEK